MSVILRSLFRDPLISRPLSRAVKRFEDDLWFDEWPSRKMRRRVNPNYETPFGFMDDISRQMVNSVNRMQNFVDEIETLDALASRFEGSDRRLRDGDAVVRRTESGNLQLALDVAEYKPEDLKIKLVDDNLVVEAESEVSGENSYRRSHFKRWFKVPEDCKIEAIKSKLTDDNRLLIDLPLNKPLKNTERSIPIEMDKSASEKHQAVENGQQQQQHQHHENRENADGDQDLASRRERRQLNN